MPDRQLPAWRRQRAPRGDSDGAQFGVRCASCGGVWCASWCRYLDVRLVAAAGPAWTIASRVRDHLHEHFVDPSSSATELMAPLQPGLQLEIARRHARPIVSRRGRVGASNQSKRCEHESKHESSRPRSWMRAEQAPPLRTFSIGTLRSYYQTSRWPSCPRPSTSEYRRRRAGPLSNHRHQRTIDCGGGGGGTVVIPAARICRRLIRRRHVGCSSITAPRFSRADPASEPYDEPSRTRGQQFQGLRPQPLANSLMWARP